MSQAEMVDRANVCLHRVDLINSNKLYPSELSGGMQKRLAIARAFLKNSHILIFDEATSSLDTLSEKYIQKALDKLKEGKTTIIIAHRLSTVENANTIVAMHNGTIIESGSHDELLSLKNYYYKLYNSQVFK